MNRALPTDAELPMSVNDCGNSNSLTFLLGEILKHLWSKLLLHSIEQECSRTTNTQCSSAPEDLGRTDLWTQWQQPHLSENRRGDFLILKAEAGFQSLLFQDMDARAYCSWGPAMQNAALQPQPDQWALANKLREHPQGQGLCLTPEWPLFSWPASGGKWPTKRTFSALRWHHDRTVTQRCSIKVPMMHRALLFSFHLCLPLVWAKCPQDWEGVFVKLPHVLHTLTTEFWGHQMNKQETTPDIYDL